MNRILTTGILLAAFAISAAAQDWYHDRDERFRGEGWRPHLFREVRSDLEHVWAHRAADPETARLDKTEQELSRMQTDFDQGRRDNGILKEFQDRHNRRH